MASNCSEHAHGGNLPLWSSKYQEKSETELNTLLKGEPLTVDSNAKSAKPEPVKGAADCDGRITFGDQETSNGIEVEIEKPKPFIYKVSENPPVHWTLLFGFQQALISILAPLSTAFVVCEVVCAQEDDGLRLQVMCATMFMVGLSTLCMNTFGVRLPIFQGPTSSYLVPLIALQSLDEYKCPRQFEAFDPETNASVVMADMGNGTSIPNREVALGKLSEPINCSFLVLCSGLGHIRAGQAYSVDEFTIIQDSLAIKAKCITSAIALDSTVLLSLPAACVTFGRCAPGLPSNGKLTGSLVVAAVFHFLVGASGLIGIFIRHIGPITIVPSILLIAIQIYPVIVKFCQTDWLVASITTITPIILSLCLAKHKTPIPLWNRSKGFHIMWYPVHQVLSILLTMIFGYMLSIILTAAGFYSSDPESKDFLARSDARINIISESDWFILPYAGRIGTYSINLGYFVCFAMATVISILDSIGDYAACARITRVSPPPPFAFNRGLFVEGVMAFCCGIMGTCNATVSFGPNIGAMGVTKVASLRVFKMTGLIFMVLAVFGKLGAFFVTIPYPVIGGVFLVNVGMFAGLLMSHLQNTDLNSVRNLAIIGITLLLGFVVPFWTIRNADSIQTGSNDLDRVIRMLLSNAAFVGGVFSTVLDNVVPGTLKERGLLAQMQDLTDTDDQTTKYEDGPEVYRLPFLPKAFRRSRFARWVPMFDTTESVDIN